MQYTSNEEDTQLKKVHNEEYTMKKVKDLNIILYTFF